MGDEIFLIRMRRDAPMHPGGPVTADVHPAEVENWLACGWREDTSPPAAPGPETSPPADSLDAMSVKELRAYAGEHDITIGAKATKKDEILAVIRAAAGESMPPASA